MRKATSSKATNSKTTSSKAAEAKATDTTATKNKLPEWTNDGQTILSAIERLLVEEKKALSFTYLNTADNGPIEYLQERFGVNRIQALVVAACVYQDAVHFNGCCTLRELAHRLQMNALQMLKYDKDIAALVGRCFLKNTRDEEGETAFAIEPIVMKAIRENRVPAEEEFKIQSNLEWLRAVNAAIKAGKRYDMDDTIVNAEENLEKRNMHLPVVRNLKKLDSKTDKWSMLTMMCAIVNGDAYFNQRDIEQVLNSRTSSDIARQLKAGTHWTQRKGYVENYTDDGMAQSERWILTRQAWMDMLENAEEAEEMKRDELQCDFGLTRYSSLKQRPLYFSGNTKKQVERLSDLLNQEQFNKVREALLAQNMPCSFCCLFYGTPGTGKTELVQQLAIATGRDLMQVNLSTLRDKYVGESEKKVQEIFDQYRRAASCSEKKPILFFNEADAIFGNRLENVQHSTDKMENAMQNIILQEMEKLDGIMICTTNLTSTLDKAFDRRFLYKIEFERPSDETRKLIWKSMLSGLSEEQAEELAKRYDFSGGQIQNISRKQIINSIFSGSQELDYNRVLEDCSAEAISRNNGKRIGF
ncbi:MAG: ATP-binding protein [Paludibacteraceae bacterium]|nr:ATP-binding protein [Paludibacteraceae bacterium]